MANFERCTACLSQWLLVAAVAGIGGCMSYLHPVNPPPPPLAEPCQAVPKCSRDHVYVFLIHGMDPFNYANISGLRDYIQALGFNKTYYGQLYHTWYFKHKIFEIAKADPDAHIVLIGFSFGANMVRDLTLACKDHGIPVDLLVYLGGNTLENTTHDQPENAQHIVNILASGCVWNGAWMDRAENYHETSVWHFGSPTHKQTLEALARCLAVVAGSVPVPEPAAPTMPTADDELTPTPRPVPSAPQTRRDEWDFLKPVSRMKLPPRPAPEEQPKPGKPDPNRIASNPADTEKLRILARGGAP